MAAQDGGGQFGIGVTDAGFVTESCVLNVCAVGADGVLRTPPFEGILRGTTARRIFELAEEHLVITNNLTNGPDRLLQGAKQGPLTTQADVDTYRMSRKTNPIRPTCTQSNPNPKGALRGAGALLSRRGHAHPRHHAPRRQAHRRRQGGPHP